MKSQKNNISPLVKKSFIPEIIRRRHVVREVADSTRI
jgi:hypothetical protein